MGPERYFYHMELSNIRIIFRFTLIYVDITIFLPFPYNSDVYGT